MKVAKSKGRLLHQEAGPGKSRTEEVNTRHGVFLEALRAAEGEQTKQILEASLDEIDQAAQRFVKSPTYANLRQYKQLVQRFLSTLIRDSYHVSEQLTFDRTGSRRLLKTIQLIDHHLQELADMVLQRHRPILNLVEKLDEIRGLLCDLYQ